jgi:tripartite-type tricarboxylate transporter receptor subunit TctC
MLLPLKYFVACGLVLGAGVAAVTRLNAELVRVLRAPELAAQFRAQGVEPAHSTPQEFFATIEADLKKWGKVIAEAGIKGE